MSRQSRGAQNVARQVASRCGALSSGSKVVPFRWFLCGGFAALHSCLGRSAQGPIATFRHRDLSRQPVLSGKLRPRSSGAEGTSAVTPPARQGLVSAESASFPISNFFRVNFSSQCPTLASHRLSRANAGTRPSVSATRRRNIGARPFLPINAGKTLDGTLLRCILFHIGPSINPRVRHCNTPCSSPLRC